MRQLLIVFLVASTLSPLWPIGPNPTVGDPFLIVNIATNRLAYVDEGKIQKIVPIATGKPSDKTPVGLFTITVKAEQPYYRKKNIAGGDPKNPLGTRWLGFDAKDTEGRTYGIHGTNRPESIGRYVTAGCIRLQNKEVEELYANIPLGTKILIVDYVVSFEALAKEHGAME
ncbi:L,D-transpeptidase [Halalkalibacterium halodurans]|jgi:lipoprotein-anchoring transpeptidase ErfK/SrfK|uniref:BH1465 protein n=1 Tax=Halalkalibacterium halodurans (strain ATCC BAA-125 / DSM 18197 / FERM 7344 / JCM 9153 / C-125) TaxID=272558 RepID=Q9KCV4_HALH5|nr:L,D-transpeptidase [Halalkalibacterium halodurans]MDY7221986.1 L,D-transpeptidase [Halalkalibacterium halodurans]MDY7241262.1 L,D-transpeptidase [Halalkalibacterium halodurans]MED4082877.1 L,D-transpeptidase [Halalkalibacterium halodurans]MED4084763.1 L,D-transpeptidase [Halalkalibacterium halodurans]MED4106129.1 L,D-transpeptidase [Halalkalibacterium halodurans]